MIGEPHFRAYISVLALMALTFLVQGTRNLQAQNGTSSAPASSPGTGANPATGPGQMNPRGACFEKAGVPRSTMAKRRSIMKDARSQMEWACNDTSLSNQQRMQKIRGIIQNSRKQLADLLTSQQRQQLRQCMRQYRGHGPAMGKRRGGPRGNPCGRFSPSAPPSANSK
jgi:Spy/CpxP family protein refolding chaperone